MSFNFTLLGLASVLQIFATRDHCIIEKGDSEGLSIYPIFISLSNNIVLVYFLRV